MKAVAGIVAGLLAGCTAIAVHPAHGEAAAARFVVSTLRGARAARHGRSAS